jgi:hypothetical protein
LPNADHQPMTGLCEQSPSPQRSLLSFLREL